MRGACGQSSKPSGRCVQRAELCDDKRKITIRFVKASQLLGCKDVSLPRHQELLKRDGWIEQRTFDIGDIICCKLKGYLIVSHRWWTKTDHDPKGDKLRTIQRFLENHHEIEYVWLDFYCLPQGRRTKDEDIFFRTTPKRVNYLYLGFVVLIIADQQYVGRFWTCYESFLSMHQCSVAGIVQTLLGQERYHVTCIGAGPEVSELLKQMLVATWGKKTAWEACTILANDDILVTNQSHKVEQLKRLEKLDDEVMHTMQAVEAADESLAKRPPRPGNPENLQPLTGENVLISMAGGLCAIDNTGIAAVEKIDGTAALEETLKRLDKDGDNLADVAEIKKLLASMGFEADCAMPPIVLRRLVLTKDNKVSWEAFRVCFMGTLSVITAAYRIFNWPDSDARNALDRRGVWEVLQQLGYRLAEDHLDSVMIALCGSCEDAATVSWEQSEAWYF